jgi:glutathione S-transferase
VERVALAAAHKKISLAWIDVGRDDRSAVVAASGQERVPVLEHDGTVVVDSTEIMRYLEALKPEPRLWPTDAAARAELDVFLDWFNRLWKAWPNQIEAELVDYEEPDDERIAPLSAELGGTLDVFERLLAGREYLWGDFSAADCAVFPFVKYAAIPPEPDDDHLFHQILAEHQPLGDDHPALEAWIRRVDARPRA